MNGAPGSSIAVGADHASANIDTVHASLLHYGALRPEDQPAGTFSEYQLKQRSARLEVIDTEGGLT